MKNTAISEIFNQIADILEILGEDRFRINSYRRVARVIADMPTDVKALSAAGKLGDILSIGQSSLAKIKEFIKTGKIAAHQELLSKIPPTLLDLLAIPGVGPKGVKIIYEKLGVKEANGLKRAINNGSVAKLPGFGEKKAATIARGIEFIRTSAKRIRLDQAMEAAELVGEFLRKVSSVEKVLPAGSLRRRAETIGDVDMLVVSKKGEQVIETFTKASFVQQVLAAGTTKGSAIIHTESCPVHVDVRVVPQKSFGAAAQYFTGSKQHNVRLREMAVKAGRRLSEYGLFKGSRMIVGAAEEEIYKKLGLDYVDPLLREDRGEIEAARKHLLPKLIQTSDIKGDLHVHTKASDGSSGLREMAEAAAKVGYKYICITDHSQSSAIANGQSPKRLSRQIEEIRKLNKQLKGITILAGAEVDILADGSLDFEDALLSELDFVIGSIHSGMGSPREKVTMRTLKAMDNPYLNCIAHPTGRLLGQREAMDIDIAAVIKHAGETHTTLEVNAHPWRLDLKDTHCKMAIEAGVKLVLGTDSHNTAGFGMMHFGVATAGRGWATKNDVLNTLPVTKVKSFVKAKRPK
jgi:DNA polymerase (family 10)